MDRKHLMTTGCAALAIGLALLWMGALRAESPAATPAAQTAAVQKPAVQPTMASLDGIKWDGQVPPLDSLEGKSIVVMSFVTWCPKCNAVAPDMLSQLKKSIEDKPVVVLAVAEDVSAPAGHKFITQRGLEGPNVFYGADAKLKERFGMDTKALWTYALMNPSGKVVDSGAANSAFVGTKDYSLPRKVSEAKDLGKLQFLTPDMSPAVKALVWQLELGDVSLLTKLSQKKNLRAFNTEDQETLQKLEATYLDTQLDSIKQLSSGEMPDKISAYEKGTRFVIRFRATPQGKEVSKLVGELNSDPTFKKQIMARNFYDKSLAKAGNDPAQVSKAPGRRPAPLPGDLLRQASGEEWLGHADAEDQRPNLDEVARGPRSQALPGNGLSWRLCLLRRE